MRHHTLGYAADKKRFQAGFVARAHHDQVRLPLVGIVGDHALGITFQAGTIGDKPPALKLGDGAGHGIRGNIVRRVLDTGDVASTFEQLDHRRVNVFNDRKNAEYSPLRPGN